MGLEPPPLQLEYLSTKLSFNHLDDLKSAETINLDFVSYTPYIILIGKPRQLNLGISGKPSTMLLTVTTGGC